MNNLIKAKPLLSIIVLVTLLGRPNITKADQETEIDTGFIKLESQTIDPENQHDFWTWYHLQQIKNENDPRPAKAVCRASQQSVSIFICIFPNKDLMSRHFARTSLYYEGHGDLNIKGKLMPYGTFFESESITIAGKNIFKNILEPFFDILAIESTRNAALDFTPEEKTLREILIPVLNKKTNNNYSIVSFPLNTVKSIKHIIQHEVLHGQYETNNTYRDAVNQFWSRLSMVEKIEIQKELSWDYALSSLDEFLLIDEYQAHEISNYYSEDENIKNHPPYSNERAAKLEIVIQQAGAHIIKVAPKKE